MATSYYRASLVKFCRQSDDEIVGALTKAHAFSLEQNQRDAWYFQIKFLKEAMQDFSDGEIYFEFVIPRMGKRVDCVILYQNIIFVIEFKVGADSFGGYGIEQVHDYALDLKNFHRGSHQAAIVPILIATRTDRSSGEIHFAADSVACPVCVGLAGFRSVIEESVALLPLQVLDCEGWAGSGYLPTPTIIEAAQALYQSHNVTDIARSDSGAQNLALTDACIAGIIADAKRRGRKAICFITGVPGAGKTLAGLNIATRRATEHSDEHAVFLSGNGPLVSVLREALVRDQVAREGLKKSDAARQVNAFIQNIHHFRDAYARDLSVPHEKVVVFDEAQRAWTREQASKFMQQKRGIAGFDQSEPEFLISVMDRHQDWCVIVCLIGGGQEINTGEAGLGEWLVALRDHFPHWDVHASSLLNERDYTVDAQARDMLEDPAVSKHGELHLSVSMRSFRAEALNGFVSALLNVQLSQAQEAYSALRPRYPLYVTRDLQQAREWLRAQARGSERYGLLASSGAARLRPEGIHVKTPITPEYWFLNDRSDVRSSFYLEEVGSEFDVQGLELDWACVAWDADLRARPDEWGMFKFSGTKWQNVQAEDRRRYLLNAYRVLLTRARQGMVIFVPQGDERDPTRLPCSYDGTYERLLEAGVQPLSV
ncbi:DUF2075 domain-containing protein [Insolitispirillum peregrinum]|uniref:Uncharacterized conserved protein n=1 Tax=Insolitispirillum peregrinum TaxID=80876 RepID=A0A1N7L6Z9_9PROT|nr:DUF2075 domain-containing protein [Insolitispirillum peregrinum]SIS69576.1 Uncharacterized conserved protein [Insolitispirillum peregrinum]